MQNRRRYFTLLAALSTAFVFVTFESNAPYKPMRTPATRTNAEPIPAQKKMPTPASKPLAISGSLSAHPEIQRRIRELAKCYESRDCGFPDTDPRAHDLAVARAIAAEAEKFGVPGEGDYQFLGELLQHADGYVKSAALSALALGPTSPVALDAILRGVIAGHDENLIPAALEQLARYTTPADGERIAAALAEALERGSVNVALALALDLRDLITPANANRFAAVAASLPRDSRLRYLIENALRASALAHQGG